MCGRALSSITSSKGFQRDQVDIPAGKEVPGLTKVEVDDGEYVTRTYHKGDRRYRYGDTVASNDYPTGIAIANPLGIEPMTRYKKNTIAETGGLKV